MQPPQLTDEETDTDVFISFSPILSLPLPLAHLNTRRDEKHKNGRSLVLFTAFHLHLFAYV